MPDVGVFQRYISAAVLTIVLCSLVACGLEVYAQALLPPTDAQNPTAGTSDDDIAVDNASRFFRFTTSETNKQGAYTSNTDSVYTFLGTSVYYKIYNSYSSMAANVSSISSANTILSTAGYNRMVSLGYQKLNNADCLIPENGGQQQVRIRLYNEGAEYSAGIVVNDTVSGIIPRRYNQKSFDFYSKDSTDGVPESDDSDYSHNSSRDTSRMYIAAYAVSVGFDSSYANTQSQLLYLGFITADSKDFN